MERRLFYIIVSFAALSLLACEKPPREAAAAAPPQATDTGEAAEVDREPQTELLPPESAPPIEVPRMVMKTLSDTEPSIEPSFETILPDGSETPRPPNDFAIGPLGPGLTDEGAYRFASALASDLLAEKDASARWLERGAERSAEAVRKIKETLPDSVRIGGGVSEAGGGISFLIRFIGKTQSVSGEVHVLKREGAWFVEELLLDDPSDFFYSHGGTRFDPLTYTRFL